MIFASKVSDPMLPFNYILQTNNLSIIVLKVTLCRVISGKVKKQSHSKKILKQEVEKQL